MKKAKFWKWGLAKLDPYQGSDGRFPYFGESRIDKNRGLAKLGSTISILIGSSDRRFTYLFAARIDDFHIFLMQMFENQWNSMPINEILMKSLQYVRIQ